MLAQLIKLQGLYLPPAISLLLSLKLEVSYGNQLTKNSTYNEYFPRSKESSDVATEVVL